MENKSPVGKLALAPKRYMWWRKGAQRMGQKRAEEEIRQHLKPKNYGWTFLSIQFLELIKHMATAVVKQEQFPT